MFERLSSLIKVFLYLWLLTTIGIVLHELGHHLFGLPSMISFSRNWPLVPVTSENMTTAIIGSLAGTTINLLLSYLGLFMYKYFNEKSALKTFGMFLGLANSFLVLSAAIINLMVDLLSGTRSNDLQVVSQLLDLNIFILPVIFLGLSLWPFTVFWRDYKLVAPTRTVFLILIFSAWLIGGLLLMLLDSIFYIRLQII